MKIRCKWAESDPLYISYHDLGWGVPLHDDRQLFEFLLLEGAQAGLSWITILRKRDAYREVFDHFDPEKIAGYDDQKQLDLLADPRIVRNRLKVKAFITNAQAYIRLVDSGRSFDHYLWEFVGGEPIQNSWHDLSQLPASTAVSETMSRSLKQGGFSFVGPTICYAFMQATGMVNDHAVDCFRHRELLKPSPKS